MNGTWTLHRQADGELLAELVVTDGDFPWLYARVEARAGLAELRPLFADELRLLDDDPEAWEKAYDELRSVVTLRCPEGHDVPEFLLHLDGDEAWWRWSDETETPEMS
ncbi:hypothetical protein JIG36_47490 [Actinoplanes sp. LDG1-06]|uniref:Uncharacterized protein n=1 Tax=Paractinoplanes ovalisporus TaxID=2810368 RepID=A0ABS2ATH3_9ACTN|nr:hypothetical protein [Actinoplanes ovalisporus]MBM2623167.1 hypothetical protein [Actinoplanes ovalisporus]